jgi:hypothetical protein
VTRILIGNDFSEDVRTDRGWTGWWVQRLAWFAEDDDILVLPVAPEDAFLDYVTGLTGTRRGSLQVVTPSGGAAGGTLTSALLTDPGLIRALRAAIGARPVTEIMALWPEAAVAHLARALGAEAALPGYGFVEQAGGILANSKSFFRTIAGGTGVPTPEGAVCTSRAAAAAAIASLLDGGPVIVKHDFLSGGWGNEILSTEDGIRPIGARRAVTVTGQADIRAYLDDRWDWLSASGRGRPIAERYVQDSSAYFAECIVADEGVAIAGDGELISAPYAIGQVMPATGLEPALLDEICAGSRRLAGGMHAIGYRGVLGPDAIVTPQREVMFTEFNGRVTGSTHIYRRIGQHVVGPGYGKDRLILERVWPEGWSVMSFTSAVERATAAGLAYDPACRKGVIWTNAFDGIRGVMYCIVAEDLESGWACDGQLKSVFGGA